LFCPKAKSVFERPKKSNLAAANFEAQHFYFRKLDF